MQLDPAAYRYHLDSFLMSEEAKLDCMKVAWAYLDGWIERECGGSPEQILLGIRGQRPTRAASDPLDSDDTLASTFNNSAGETMAGKRCP